MIDKWIRQNIDRELANRQILVILGDGTNTTDIIKRIKKKEKLFEISNTIEEIKAKYKVESDTSKNKYILYVTLPKDKIKFISEYMATESFLDLTNIHKYAREEIFKALNLNINLDDRDLLVAIKQSIGRDKNYWLDVIHKNEIISIESDILPFLHHPEKYFKSIDENQSSLFNERIHELIEQPASNKPPKTLAQELMEGIFDSLMIDQLEGKLYDIYWKLMESVSYRDCIHGYAKSYNWKEKPLWEISPSHPFEKIDKEQVRELASLIQSKRDVGNQMDFIKRRASDKITRSLKLDFWKNIIHLVEFDISIVSKIESLQDAVNCYCQHFYKVDQAIQNLYTQFLSETEILLPFQTYYRQHLLEIFLNKWFLYFEDEYVPNQQGLLNRIIKENHENKIAVIIADGLSYDFAKLVSARLEDTDGVYLLSESTIRAGIPSETENNMSLIYRSDGTVTNIHNEREKYLKDELRDLDIEFEFLEKISQADDQFQFLICTFKDIDDLGEKSQQASLKYKQVMLELLSSKIQQLIANGYNEVHLISDHGYVLTGLLSESDKISINIHGDHKVAERYIRSKQHPQQDTLITLESDYKDFHFISFSKSIAPFKTKGRYGYSHGGIAPQELLTPHFIWTGQNKPDELTIIISNKADLRDVVGDLFVLKLSNLESKENLFNTSRQIRIQIYDGKYLIKEMETYEIKHNVPSELEFEFFSKDKLSIRIIDSTTKVTLDKCEVLKNKGRDLGGLL